MKKLMQMVALLMCLLIASLPTTLAASSKATPVTIPPVFSGLSANVAQSLVKAGVVGLAVGVAYIVGSTIVAGIGKNKVDYTTAYSYNKLAEHVYKHIKDFPYSLGSNPPRKDFEKKCLDTINSKSSKVTRYFQPADNRIVVRDSGTTMTVIGDMNGKTVVTCYPVEQSDLTKKLNKGEWTKMKEIG